MPTASKPKGLRYSTVQSYISGVKSWALDHGITVPPADEMGPVKVMLKGLKRLQHGRERAARLPVTVELCGLIRSVLDLRQHNHRTFWAMLATGVRGLFRLGELAVDNTTNQDNRERLLLQQDLAPFHDAACKGYTLRLRISKSDAFRESTNIYLFFTRDLVCAASALEDMIRRCPFHRGSSTPLFALDDGRPLLRPKFIELLQQCIRLVNTKFHLDYDWSRFTGHSIRRGGATSLAARGVADHLIQTMGRWKSNAHRIYIATPRYNLFQATASLNVPDQRDGTQLAALALASLNHAPYAPEEGGR